MSTSRIQIRNADILDLPVLSRFGAELARLHSSFDVKRFAVRELTETAFGVFFAEQPGRQDAVLFVAEQDGATVGYAFVRMGAASLEELRSSGAWLHDLYVDPAVRGKSIGRQLLEAAINAARGLGSSSLMLSVSTRNKRAHRLFEEVGLRDTMTEMRMELKNESGI